MISREELEKAKAVCEAATPGPWAWERVNDEPCHYQHIRAGAIAVADTSHENGLKVPYFPIRDGKAADAEAIVTARNLLPRLIDEHLALMEDRDILARMLGECHLLLKQNHDAISRVVTGVSRVLLTKEDDRDANED